MATQLKGIAPALYCTMATFTALRADSTLWRKDSALFCDRRNNTRPFSTSSLARSTVFW